MIEPEIFRTSIFRRAERNASPRRKSTKSSLEILTHSVAKFPNAVGWSVEQTDKPLSRFAPSHPSHMLPMITVGAEHSVHP